jgi:hypothetical protein
MPANPLLAALNQFIISIKHFPVSFSDHLTYAISESVKSCELPGSSAAIKE